MIRFALALAAMVLATAALTDNCATPTRALSTESR